MAARDRTAALVPQLGQEGRLVVAGHPYRTPGAVHTRIFGSGQWIALSEHNLHEDTHPPFPFVSNVVVIGVSPGRDRHREQV